MSSIPSRHVKDAWRTSLCGSRQRHIANSLLWNSDQDYDVKSHVCHAYMMRGIQYNQMWEMPHMPYTSRFQEYKRLPISRTNISMLYAMRNSEWSATKAWYDFLLNDEIFGQAFYPTTLRKALWTGAQINLDVHQAVGMTALTAWRLPREFPARLFMWHCLVTRGVNPRVAMVLADVYRDGEIHSFSLASHGHQLFDSGLMNGRALRRLFNGQGPEVKNERDRLKYGYYSYNAHFTAKGVNSEPLAKGLDSVFSAHTVEVWDAWDEKWVTKTSKGAKTRKGAIDAFVKFAETRRYMQ